MFRNGHLDGTGMADGSMGVSADDNPDRILNEIKQLNEELRRSDRDLLPSPNRPWERTPDPPDPVAVLVNDLLKAAHAKELRTELVERAVRLRTRYPDLPPVPPYTKNPVCDVLVALRDWCVQALMVWNQTQDQQPTRNNTPVRQSQSTDLPDNPSNATAMPSDDSETPPAEMGGLPLVKQDFQIPSGQDPQDVSESASKSQPARHGPDFRSVHWYGTDYSFTVMQAAVVAVLWESWKNGTPDVGNAKLLSLAGGSGDRLRDVFKDHPAWGTIIVDGKTKGSTRLCEPTGD